MPETNEETSPLLKAANILEENGFRVLKAEEEINNPHSFKGTISLRIAPKSSLKKEEKTPEQSPFLSSFKEAQKNG